ncbi:MAG: response regulator [Gemmatimonadaceae bacterium]|nr:response regulator [Gemmatimonadaceae bacterium]
MSAPDRTLPTILVVEDEPHIGRIIRTRLEQDGFPVEVAETGAAALERLEAMPQPALIVLDLMLPLVSGVEVLRAVRREPRWQSLPCIILTAAGQDEQLREVEALGVSEIMTKPFSPRRLLARVRACLDEATRSTMGSSFPS